MAQDPFSQCNVQIYRSGAQLLVNLAGWLRMGNCEEVKKRVIALMEPPIDKIYINLAGVQEVDSAGLGMLVGLHMTARKQKVDFSLLPTNPTVKKLLDATRLSSILTLINAEEAREVQRRLEDAQWLVPSENITEQ